MQKRKKKKNNKGARKAHPDSQQDRFTTVDFNYDNMLTNQSGTYMTSEHV